LLVFDITVVRSLLALSVDEQKETPASLP